MLNNFDEKPTNGLICEQNDKRTKIPGSFCGVLISAIFNIADTFYGPKTQLA